jgi:TPR repeat protein
MRKALVLFFAADPFSLPRYGKPALRLLEEIRKIREHVRASLRRVLEFDCRLAARTDDLMLAFRERRPVVVHFSGHGGTPGLYFISPDGSAGQPVRAEALAKLFQKFRGDIKVVLLSACYSAPQAKAIAEAVGCAIGTPGTILDDAAITFNASFYQALAFGHSVLDAFNEACIQLGLDNFEEAEFPKLELGRGVDPARLIVVHPPIHVRVRRFVAERWMWIVTALVWLASLAGAVKLGVVLVLALALSLVPLLITGAMLRYARSPARRGIVLPAWVLSAVGLSAAAVVAGSSVINHTALERAKRRYDAANHPAAFSAFQRLADAGNAEAMGFVGIMRMTGQGTPQHDSAGADWLSRAAGRGDARAMYVLGIAYETGEGVDKSEADAVRMYRAAQARGYVEAANKLGELYRLGIGVGQSYDSALIWYRTAADGGSADGMINMGLMFELGLGVSADSAAAREWYRRAADLGSVAAMIHLGWIYENGLGVPRDEVKARAWYLKAAEAGSADGMNNLGVLYARGGGGVPQDLDLAAYWFSKADSAGSDVAERNRAALGAGGS